MGDINADDVKKAAKHTTTGTAQTLKGAKLATTNYKISIPTKGNNVVNVIDKTLGRVGKDGAPKGDWVLRFDKPHKGANYNHININPEISGVPDPHTAISATTLKGAKTTAKVLKTANKVLVPAAIAIDTVRVGYNVAKDIDRGTTRNTVETAASVAGGWGGGYGGACAGAAVGTAIFPGVGTMIGGIVGGVSGGIAGGWAASEAVSFVGDEVDWDIEEYKCEKCGRWYKCRKYQDQSKKYCPNCI